MKPDLAKRRPALILLWAAVLFAAFATTTPKPWLLTCIGIGLGCVSVQFQSRTTAAGVAGKTVKAFGWLCGIGLLILAMAFAENMFLGALASSFAGYLLACSVFGFRDPPKGGA